MKKETKNTRLIRASPENIYKALTTPGAIEIWQVPEQMVGKVDSFDLRQGGGYKMSLFYPETEKEMKGKTSEKEDRFTAKFVEIIPPKKITQAIIFDSTDQDFSGEMIMDVTIEPTDNGTNVTFLFKNLPKGIKPEDNEAGTLSSLEKLTKYVE